MEDQDYVLSYVDTLLDLRFPANHDKTQLTERDILSFCNEFLNAGAGTTTTALEWILANLVKYPEIQEKLFMEIKGVVRDGDQGVKEDDLQEMPYLKAIILEGLRRHPPTHVSLPHAVTEDTTLNEYLVPKQGSREIKTMPFGVGRRMCPGYGLAMLILEYFVANLIWSFEWKAVDGDGVDLSEKQELTMVMKNPLQVQISPRWKNN
uniref:Cytochrome P450 n=1 Tax=Salix viminalis TaxID=40686 RepID=A0A6N2NEA3_SALVM